MKRGTIPHVLYNAAQIRIASDIPSYTVFVLATEEVLRVLETHNAIVSELMQLKGQAP